MRREEKERGEEEGIEAEKQKQKVAKQAWVRYSFTLGSYLQSPVGYHRSEG